MKKILVFVGVVASVLGLFTFLTGKDLTSFRSANFDGEWSDLWGGGESESCHVGVGQVSYHVRLDQDGDVLTGKLSAYWWRLSEKAQFDLEGRVEGNIGQIALIDRTRSPAVTEAVARISEDDFGALLIQFTSGNPEDGVVYPDSEMCKRGPDDQSPLEEWGLKP